MVILPFLFTSASVDDSQQNAPSTSLTSDTSMCVQRVECGHKLTHTISTTEVYKCSVHCKPSAEKPGAATNKRQDTSSALQFSPDTFGQVHGLRTKLSVKVPSDRLSVSTPQFIAHPYPEWSHI